MNDDSEVALYPDEDGHFSPEAIAHLLEGREASVYASLADLMHKVLEAHQAALGPALTAQEQEIVH